jgi:hypothetical protein
MWFCGLRVVLCAPLLAFFLTLSFLIAGPAWQVSGCHLISPLSSSATTL